jgi:hypothetical protein
MAEPNTKSETISAGDSGRRDVLTTGSRGQEVLDLQRRLSQAGFDTGATDGVFGPQTAEAIRRFQLAAGLPTDGVFGPQTAMYLELYLAVHDPDQPLPDPHDADGRPLLLDVIGMIGTLEDPLERVRRLLEMMDRAQKYEDTEADAEASRFAFQEARAALGGEKAAEALRSEEMRQLMKRFETRGDDRAEQLKKLMEAAASAPDGRTAEKAGQGEPDASGASHPTPSAKAASVTPKIATDIWNREDQLGYAAYARALAALITHHETMPPLTIGIKAQWGAGKTSLMRMVQALLDGQPEHTGMSASDRKSGAVMDAGSITVDGGWQTGVAYKELFRTLEKPSEPAARVLPVESEPGTAFKIQPRVTVWFNAWKYQNSEQLWAGLAHCIVSQVTARLSPVERERFWLKVHARRVDVNKVRQSFYRLVFQEFLPRGIVWAAGALIALATGFVLPKVISLLGFAGSAALVTAMLSDWNKKLKTRMEDSVEGMFRDFVRSPSYEGKLGFLHLVESDLREVLKLVATPERPLVLFIDDLDRCAPHQVAQVVEAINLFLGGDYPDCVFVLGMEPEMVAAALDVSYGAMDEILKETSTAGDRAPLGWRFMEKIIQLPLTIPPPMPEDVDRYLRVLLKGADEGPPAEEKLSEEEVAQAETQMEQAGNLDEVESMTLEKMRQEQSEGKKAVLREASKRVYARKLAMHDPMVQRFINDSATWFNDNPRQIKRYINLFRFYATLRYAYMLDGVYEKPDAPMPPDGALAKFVALSIHWPQAIGWLWVKHDRKQSSLAWMEQKARELASNAKDKNEADTAWEASLKEAHFCQDWALDAEFRSFLAAGEVLGDYQGCRLW